MILSGSTLYTPPDPRNLLSLNTNRGDGGNVIGAKTVAIYVPSCKKIYDI